MSSTTATTITITKGKGRTRSTGLGGASKTSEKKLVRERVYRIRSLGLGCGGPILAVRDFTGSPEHCGAYTARIVIVSPPPPPHLRSGGRTDHFDTQKKKSTTEQQQPARSQVANLPRPGVSSQRGVMCAPQFIAKNTSSKFSVLPPRARGRGGAPARSDPPERESLIIVPASLVVALLVVMPAR